MATGNVKKISGDDFKEEIGKGVVLVDFFADWCGPCRMISPVLEKVAVELGDKASIAKLDIDQYQDVASTYQITSVPTMVLFKEGEEVGRIVGLRDASQLKEFITASL